MAQLASNLRGDIANCDKTTALTSGFFSLFSPHLPLIQSAMVPQFSEAVFLYAQRANCHWWPRVHFDLAALFVCGPAADNRLLLELQEDPSLPKQHSSSVIQCLSSLLTFLRKLNKPTTSAEYIRFDFNGQPLVLLASATQILKTKKYYCLLTSVHTKNKDFSSL